MPSPQILSSTALLVGATCLLSACVGDSKDDTRSVDDFDFTAMFANYADTIILPNYNQVQQLAQHLSSENSPITSYCSAIDTDEESEQLAEAQAAWKELQAAIQHSESHLVGPVIDNGSALRARLSAYHAGDLSTCGIDQSVVLNSTDSSFNISSRTATQRGIGALEYLLFNTDLNHTCPSQITETSDWEKRPLAQRKLLRCDYAQTLAEDLTDAADALVNAWASDGDNYRSEFINPVNTAESLSALSDAMFYIEIDVKDSKLGLPTGINDACASLACPENVESPYSQTSLINIRNNLLAFERMLTGGDGQGFDDIIALAGVSDLTDDFLDNIGLAIDSIDQQSTSLWQQTSAIDSIEDEAACTNAFANPLSPSAFPACSLYGLVKRITDDLKIGFVTAVDVDLPDRSQSDND